MSFPIPLYEHNVFLQPRNYNNQEKITRKGIMQKEILLDVIKRKWYENDTKIKAKQNHSQRHTGRCNSFLESWKQGRDGFGTKSEKTKLTLNS